MSKNLLIGIDEAGLGPRLGPLVVTAVLIEREGQSQDTAIERLLAEAISRDARMEEARLRVDDSKIVYRGGNGFSQLEKTAVSFWFAAHACLPESLKFWIEKNTGSEAPDLRECPWYGQAPHSLRIPLVISEEMILESSENLRSTMNRNGIPRCSVKQRILTAPALNRKIDRLGLKSKALIDCVTSLMREVLAQEQASSIEFDVDKLGGRCFYQAMLQGIFPYTSIDARLESRKCSSYRLTWEGRRIRVRFIRHGDAQHAQIALASILSKYTRELFMNLFNRFWSERVASLRPTAGYPTDAARFLEQIAAAARAENLDQRAFTRAR
ncbi:MAG: ribonuclease H family protein [Planctomycetota bacterium]